MLIARRRKLDTFYYACVGGGGGGGNGSGCHNDRKTHCNRDNQSVGPSFLLLSLRFVMIMWWRRLRVTDKWFRSSRHSPLFCLPRSIFSLRQCALFFSADTHGQEIFSIFHGNQARTHTKSAPRLIFLCHRNDNNLLIIHPCAVFSLSRFFASRFSIFFSRVRRALKGLMDVES